jgi:hypothetical protein
MIARGHRLHQIGEVDGICLQRGVQAAGIGAPRMDMRSVIDQPVGLFLFVPLGNQAPKIESERQPWNRSNRILCMFRIGL